MTIKLRDRGPIVISQNDDCLDEDACRPLLDQLSDHWSINGDNRLNAVFLFENFDSALAFLNQVGAKAESINTAPIVCFHGPSRGVALDA